MTTKDVIRLLMLSPFYFRLSLRQRHNLFQEFCRRHQI